MFATTSTAATGPNLPDDDALDRIEGLAERGLFLQAWNVARPFAPLGRWRGPRGRSVAAGLAVHLGAPGLAARIHLRASREHPASAVAQAWAIETVLDRRGPLPAWTLMVSLPPATDGTARDQATLVYARAHTLARLRDFDAARLLLEAAPETGAGRREISRSFVLLLEDRTEQALEIARDVLAGLPGFRAAVQLTAQCLTLLDRREEALAVLNDGARAIESAHLFRQRAAVEMSLRQHDDARASIELAAELSPIMDAATRRAHEAALSSIAYRRGDVPASIVHARRAGGKALLAVADRMERSSPDGRKVELEVPFVRQHRATCAPATLTAISRFWGMPADHLSVVEAICYDGTPAHSLRRWAEDGGWAAGEFTLTWDSAQALVDRGVPFVALISSAVEGHAQAIVGYDERRKSFYIRDPTRPDVLEADVEEFLRAFASGGPRALWLVPRAEASRVDGLALPDARLWDRLYDVQRALSVHDRAKAIAQRDSLVREAPEHVIAFAVSRAIAAYDGDVSAVRDAAAGLLRLHPHDARAELDVYAGLRELAPRSERIAWLETCARPGADPIFLEQLADELHEDAREHTRVARLLRRALRARPERARPLTVLGLVAWNDGRFEAALSLFRFAACLEDANDDLARAYFGVARARGATEQALGLLEARVERLGGRSSAPAMTLHAALELVERPDAAAQVLAAALERRPEDGDLLLYAASVQARRGEGDGGRALLARAEAHVSRTRWVGVAARIARAGGEPVRAVELLREAVDAEPLDAGARTQLVEVLMVVEGHAAAIAHVEQAVERFPHNRRLLQLAAQLQIESGPEAHERAARRAIAAEPGDAWGHRELALALASAGRHEEAQSASDRARAIAPNDVRQFLVGARVLQSAGDAEGALRELRAAVRLAPDTELAVASLVAQARDAATRAADLELVEAEIVAHAVDGSAILALHDGLRAVLDPDVALGATTRLREARVDLWPAWSADVRQHVATGRLEEAAALARQATDRFPLVGTTWIDRADVARDLGERASELAFLDQAHAVAPLDTSAAARLAEALERGGDVARAREVLERAAFTTTDARAGLLLVALLDRAGERDAALREVRRVLGRHPDLEGGWQELFRLMAASGRKNDVVVEARRAADARPWSATMARVASSLALQAGDAPLAMEHLARALQVSPRSVEAHDQRVLTLAKMGRLDDAAAACLPQVFGDEVPVELRGRAAWLKLKRGDVAGATADFRALVAEQPTYYWGWLQLLDAYTTTSDHAGRAAVAEKIVALAPHLPQGHVARGDACLTAGDRAGAKASWGRAAQLSGADAYPLVRLVRAAVEDRDLATAQRWCGRLRAVAGDVALPNEARIAIAMGERRRAVDLFRQACTSRTIAPELVALVHRLAVLAGLGNEALAVLEAVFAEGHPSAGAAVLWALASVERADGRAESWVVRADPASEVTAAVARAIALRLSTRDERRRLRRLVDGLPRSVCDAPDVQNALRHALDRVRKRSPEKQRARTRIGYFLGAAALVAVLIFSMATHHTELVVSPPAGFVGVVILLRLALSKRG